MAEGESIGTRDETESVIGQSESQSVVVTVNAWANAGARYACGTWSPDVSTTDYGTEFTQTRSCSQDQTRTYTHKVGSTTVHTNPVSQTISETESQSATGIMEMWVATTDTVTPFVSDGSEINVSAWLPAFTNQTTGFQKLQLHVESASLWG